MELNYADSRYIRAYNTLFSGTGKICRDKGIPIDRNDYANGYALYTFDRTADQGDEKNFNLMRQGSVRLVLKFSQALAMTVTVVVYAEFENVIEIDRKRNVIYDFGVKMVRTCNAPFDVECDVSTASSPRIDFLTTPSASLQHRSVVHTW